MIKKLIAFLCLSSCLFGKEKEILFVGFDAAETQIWAQVLKSWEGAPQSQLLTMATATKVAMEASLEHITVESLGVSCPIHQRLYELSAAELEKINQIPGSVLVTGMYSTPERQIAEVFQKKGSRVISVWDNFSTYDKLPRDLVANVEKIMRASDAVLVPSQDIADDLNTRFNSNKAIALGQPTLDVWKDKVAEVDKSAALAKTPFNRDKPILTYISGYQEKGNGYRESFILFVKSLNELKVPVQVVVQLHPRSDGKLEKEILDRFCQQNHRYFISDGKQLSTYEAVALCDLGITHRSIVAIQALFAGKRFMHIDIPGTPFSHFAIEKKLIVQCLKAEEATHYLSEHLNDEIDLSNLYEKSGIVPFATKRYRSLITSMKMPERRQNDKDFPSQ